MRQRFYLDWNATAPVSPGVRGAMAEALAIYGNPSSVHEEGRKAKTLVEQAREKVAALVGASPGDVIFTSGGTEANHLALSPPAGAPDAPLFISAIEHPSVRSGGRFSAENLSDVAVTQDGVLDLNRLADVLKEHQMKGGPFMLSVMAANNETGVVQPVAEAARMAHEAGGTLHCDAVQMVGKLPVSFDEFGADTMALAAHKIRGPKGVGALVMRGRAGKEVDAMMRGGGQESGWRAGTENVAGIVGFSVAAEEASASVDDRSQIARLRDRLEHEVRAKAPDALIFGEGADRLPNTSCFAVEGLTAETLVMGLDLAGVAISSGAACSSGKVKGSAVLAAMGVTPELAQCAIRVSIGADTTDREIDHFLSAWSALYQRQRQRRAAA